MRTRARLLVAAPALAVVLAARGVHAAEPVPVTARLEWERAPGAESCVDGPALEQLVNERWKREVFVHEPSSDLLLKGAVERRAGQWVATLTLYRDDGDSLGTRELAAERGEECASLDEAVALASGLMLDVSRRRIEEERAAVAASSPSPPPPRAKLLDGPPLAIPPPARTRGAVRLEPRLGGELALGFLPGIAVGPRTALAFVPDRFAEIDLGATFFEGGTAEAGSGRGATFGAVAMDLSLCPLVLGFARAKLRGCVIERVGSVRASGYGFARAERATQWVSSAGLRGTASVVLVRPLSLFVATGAEALLVRGRFSFHDARGTSVALYRMSPVAGFLAFGLSLVW